MKFSLLYLFTLLFCVTAFAKKPFIAKEPSWATKSSIDYSIRQSSKDMEEGVIDIVLEEQTDLASQTVYTKRAIQIITEAGVQNSSTVSVNYDPSYQQVVFHSLIILRDNKSINKLYLAKMKAVQQEKELDRSIYNGSLTALFLLDDVRKGDIIEYSYSVTGFNPVFNNKFSTTLDMQYGVPVAHLYYKIICRSQRKLHLQNNLTNIQPAIGENAAGKIYEWNVENVQALKSQGSLPSWFDPYPNIMISEFDNWKDVIAWSLPLFKNSEQLSASLQTKIGEIKKRYSTTEQQACAALHFVQDEVRYLGIEIGANTHKPNSPNKIFAQRFGDCKDKSFLLCSMFQSLGINAFPVLINASSQKSIMNWLPSPLNFNHCTVKAIINNKTYYFDPTISLQRGGLENISYPDYQCGLVVADTTSSLSTIPLQDKGEVITKEVFMMQNIDSSARLNVVTTFSGSFADEVRDQINNGSTDDLEKGYTDFYNKFYTNVRVRDSLKIKDDSATGKITTYEYYTIGNLWNFEKGVIKSSYYGLLINSILRKPDEKNRTMPFSIKYPAHYVEEIELNLPEPWSFDTTPETITTSSFIYKSSKSNTESSINIKYEYTALRDYVDVKDAKNFFTDYEKMRDDLGYELTKGEKDTVKKTHNSSDLKDSLIGIIVLLIIIIAFVIRITRR